ncbi:MAG: leucine-rich repeat domain-containing protein [Treponemataceae bacterium]|nr:leucine-rich repeat domain-containing protein [Treponemataceae bacterium]
MTKISDDAFWGCTSLASVTIPESVTEIGGGSFRGSGLKTVTIPKGVKVIGDTLWGDGTFKNCTSLESVTLSRGVAVIGEHVFYGCTSLKSVSIPRSVTVIYGLAFSNCDNLTVQYDGTKVQWEAVKKGAGKSDSIGSFAVRCSDGEFSKQEWE